MTDAKTHPGVHQSWKSLWVPKTLNNSAQNGLESAKYVSVDNRHVSAPWGSSIVEISPGPETTSYSPQNGPESAKTASVDERHVSASLGSTTMEIASGPQKGE